MVEERYQVPLSPPSSPRMSDNATKTGDYHHGPHHLHHASSGPTSDYQSYQRDRSIPPLRSYRNTPYSLGSGAHYGHEGNTSAPSTYDDRQLLSDPHSMGPADLQSSTYDDSTPASLVDRLTPRSPGASNKDQADDDDLVDDFGGEEPEDEGERPPMTAAELRAQKRKMKRFRLTHNQTRFLLSEFARQPHPDAAQRERLAREIPGLSARQVQVWFQNRRAKLKRLTQDDRERMMRSRALPSGFDTTQALHSPFGAQPPSMGAPMSSSIGGFATYGDSSAVRPLTLDTLRRVPDYEQYGQQYSSPTGVSPALGAFAFTPPQSTSGHLSPGSATSSMSPYVLQQQVPYEASRRPPTGLPSSGHTPFTSQPQLQRLPLHERLNRTMGESTGSPLRTSVSYSTLNSTSTPRHIPERAASFSEHSVTQPRPQLQSIGSPSGEPGPYGLGFSYSQVPQYQQTNSQQQNPLGGQVQQATDTDQFRRPAYSAYPASTYRTSHVPQYAGYPTPYSSQNYSSAYAQHGQVTEPVSDSQPGQPMHEAHQNAAGASHPYMLSAYNGHRVTESQGHDGGY